MILKSYEIKFSRPRGFLVLDGVNGAGKTTLMKRIVRHLQERSFPVLSTREPGATALGAELRRILLASKPGTVAPLSEVFLFAADRHNHVKQLIEPALKQGHVVLSDRYYYSTTAFQGYGRELDLNIVQAINDVAIAGCLPDFLLLLDLEPEEGLRRAGLRLDSQDKDGFEQEGLEFHHRLRRGFLEIAKNCAEPVVVLDASLSQDQIWMETAPLIDAWLAVLKREGA